MYLYLLIQLNNPPRGCLCANRYIPAFVSNGYTRLEYWATHGISPEEYTAIGVHLAGHRRMISTELLALKEKGNKRNESKSDNASDSDEDSDDEDSDDEVSSEEEE
jgi:hypothetical protein